MIDDPFFAFTGVDDIFIRKEKAKARELRKTRWWKNKIAQGICHYCRSRTPRQELTMDHIVPLARGGSSIKSNLAAACKSCNTKKKTMLPQEWEEYMDALDKGKQG